MHVIIDMNTHNVFFSKDNFLMGLLKPYIPWPVATFGNVFFMSLQSAILAKKHTPMKFYLPYFVLATVGQ